MCRVLPLPVTFHEAVRRRAHPELRASRAVRDEALELEISWLRLLRRLCRRRVLAKHRGLVGVQVDGCSTRLNPLEQAVSERDLRKDIIHDNAVAESFFATLKTELEDSLESRAAATRQLHLWIHRFYNRWRRHSAIGGISPLTFERLVANQVKVA